MYGQGVKKHTIYEVDNSKGTFKLFRKSEEYCKGYGFKIKFFHDDVSLWSSKTVDENQKTALAQSRQNFGGEITSMI